MERFDLSAMEPRQRYQLMTRVVGPRPIAFVSSLSPDGVGNLAPFSYFMLGGVNPPSVIFCPVNDRAGAVKDSARNVQTTGEFVINVVTRAMAERMNQCSFAYPPEVDELEKIGFTPLPGERVAPPRVAESPLQLECRLFTILRHGAGPLASNYVVGEVLLVHADPAVLTDGLPDAAKLDLVARLGGDDYAHVAPESLFQLPRPTEG